MRISTWPQATQENTETLYPGQNFTQKAAELPTRVHPNKVQIHVDGEVVTVKTETINVLIKRERHISHYMEE